MHGDELQNVNDESILTDVKDIPDLPFNSYGENGEIDPKKLHSKVRQARYAAVDSTGDWNSLEQLLVSTNDDATRSSIIKKFEEYFNQKGTLSYDESKRIIIEYLIRHRIVHTSYEYKDDDDIPNKEFDLVESFEEDIIKTYYVKFFSYEHPFVRIKYDGDFQKFLDKVEQERTEYLTTGKLPFEKKTPEKSKL